MLSLKELNQQFMNQADREWASRTAAAIKDKVAAVSLTVGTGIPYSTVNGRFDDWSDRIEWWCNGFWGGLLWLMYTETHDERYLEQARSSEAALDACFRDFVGMDHDAGFRWLPTAVADYRLTGNDASRRRGLLAATILAGRYNPAGEFIRAWDGLPTAERNNVGWGIIDCMMNLPILYWASEETQDPRFREIAMKHADTVSWAFVRPDGSCEHIVEFDPFSGEKVTIHGGQGYADGSSWTRGQAWGLYGFVLSYIHSGKEAYLDTAKRIAHYFMANIPESGHIPVDFRQPPEPAWEDSTAAAIASCGLIELARHVPDGERHLYLQAALKLLKALDRDCCCYDRSNDAIVQKCTAAYHDKEHEFNIIYGDSYYAEAVFKLTGNDFLIW